ncbi:MAG: 4Fe-4S dicluster domain-containing protein [Bacteroidales bacterium]
MLRKIVEINEEKCTGCGLCIDACHEGALQLVNGKAQLVSDVYCDGLGACLPECPADAISIIEREAAAFDEEAMKKHPEAKKSSQLRQWPCQIKLVPVNAPFLDNAVLLITADCPAYAYANFHFLLK